MKPLTLGVLIFLTLMAATFAFAHQAVPAVVFSASVLVITALYTETK